MRFLWLGLLVCITPLYSMEQGQLSLDLDTTFLIQKLVFINNKRTFFFDGVNSDLSSNYAEFDEQGIKQSGQLSNIQLMYNEQLQPIISLVGLSYGVDVILNNNPEVAFFDGPNQENVLATDQGCCILDLRKYNNPQEAKEHLGTRKKNRYLCWCRDCKSYEIIPKFLEYPIIDHYKRIGAVAVYKKSNLFAVAYDNMIAQKVMLYVLDSYNEMHLFAQFEMPLHKDTGYIKKISFLTDRTLLALTDKGILVSLARRKKNKITMHKQSIVDAKKNLLTVQDFAVDQYRPTRMLMMLENNKMVFGDLGQCTYTPLLQGVKTEVLKFYNNLVAYKESGNNQLTIFNLQMVKKSKLFELLEEYFRTKSKK